MISRKAYYHNRTEESRKNGYNITYSYLYINIHPICIDTISEVVISLQDMYLTDWDSIDPDNHNA